MVIEKYIRIALVCFVEYWRKHKRVSSRRNNSNKKCYHHRNYSTLMQILLGLQSPAVSRLKRTWQRIDSYEMRIFNELQELAKPFHNWKNVREAMSKAIENVAESSAVESVLTSNQTDLREFGCVRGCIPFLGLYLSDLVFNAELPTFIAAGSANSASDNSRGYVDDDEALRSRLSTHFVNYNKFRVTGKTGQHFQVKFWYSPPSILLSIGHQACFSISVAIPSICLWWHSARITQTNADTAIFGQCRHS